MSERMNDRQYFATLEALAESTVNHLLDGITQCRLSNPVEAKELAHAAITLASAIVAKCNGASFQDHVEGIRLVWPSVAKAEWSVEKIANPSTETQH